MCCAKTRAVIGTSFFVMSHVAGQARVDVSLPDLSPTDRGRLVYSYADTLAQLHSYDHVALGLADFGPPGNYFERQVSRWSRQYAETETEPLPEMHELIAWLTRSIAGAGTHEHRSRRLHVSQSACASN